MPFPPSPALSVCDSLADIDDLDAYLDAQPALSHFPTPPPNDGPTKDTHFVECLDEPEVVEYSYVAETLAGDVDVAAVDAVHSILRHAQLPLEILAIASNILSALETRRISNVHQSSRALTVVAALSLAVSYSSDHAPNSCWWAKRVCQERWTTSEVDRAVLCIYAALDWNLHRFTDLTEIDQAMTRLSRDSLTREMRVDSVTETEKMPMLVQTISLASSGE